MTGYVSDNPQFDHLINSLDSDEVPTRRGVVMHDFHCESYAAQGPRRPVLPCQCAARAFNARYENTRSQK